MAAAQTAQGMGAEGFPCRRWWARGFEPRPLFPITEAFDRLSCVPARALRPTLGPRVVADSVPTRRPVRVRHSRAQPDIAFAQKPGLCSIIASS